MLVHAHGPGTRGQPIPPWIHADLLIASAIAAGLLFYPVLSLPIARRRAIFAPVCLALLALPFTIAPEHWPARLAAAMAAGIVSMKIWDQHVARGTGVPARAAAAPPTLRRYAAFLFHPLSIVERRLALETPRPLSRCLTDLAIGLTLAVGAAGAYFLLLLPNRDHLPRPVYVTLRPLLLLPFALGFFAIPVAIWRSLGERTTDYFGNVLTATTPAVFWRRWNRPTFHWFHDDVFLPAGGRRAPARAILIAFAVSALGHEYLATMLNGRIEGWQLAFFMLQGLAVVLTIRLRPTGRAATAAMFATLAFNIASSALFLMSARRLIP